MKTAPNCDAGRQLVEELGGNPMSYAEAKEIALLRLELRTCWDRDDRQGALTALGRMAQVAGDDNELVAEVRRWAFRFA
jgi:hypothetical protein